MALQGVLGNGTKVGFSASSPVSYTKIGQLMNITKFIDLIAAVVDNTVMGTSNVMTGMPGMIPIPTFEFDLLADFDQATSPAHETLRQYSTGAGGANAGAVIYFRIEVPVNRAQSSFRAWEFQCFINGYSPQIAIGAVQQLKIVAVYAGGLSVYNAAASTLG